MPIIRWNPLEEMGELFDEMQSDDYGLDLAVDLSEDNDTIYIEMHIPGVEADNIDIELDNQHLRIKGFREKQQETEDKNYYQKEIRRGSFERIVALPSLIQKDNVSAEIKDGILYISLAKEKRFASHKIKVNKK